MFPVDLLSLKNYINSESTFLLWFQVTNCRKNMPIIHWKVLYVIEEQLMVVIIGLWSKNMDNGMKLTIKMLLSYNTIKQKNYWKSQEVPKHTYCSMNHWTDETFWIFLIFLLLTLLTYFAMLFQFIIKLFF